MEKPLHQETTSRKRGLRRDHVILGLIVTLAVVIIGIYGFAQREIDTYLRFRPWQTGEAQGLLDRFHQATTNADVAQVGKCLGAPASVSGEGSAAEISFPGAQGAAKHPVKKLAELGPFKTTRLELSYFGQGSMFIHARDGKDRPVRFDTTRAPDGSLRISGMAQ